VADELRLDVGSMSAAVALAEWFKHEARRVYAVLDESDVEQGQHQLVEWIRHRGGRVTARDVQTYYRRLKGPGLAEAALEGLVQAGLGSWQDGPTTPKGGRPARTFVLTTLHAPAETSQGKPSAKPPKTQEILSSADADITEERETKSRQPAAPSPGPDCLAEPTSPAGAVLGEDKASELGTEGEL